MKLHEFGFYEGRQVYWEDIDKDSVGPMFNVGLYSYRNAKLLAGGRFGNKEQRTITVDWSLKPYTGKERKEPKFSEDEA